MKMSNKDSIHFKPIQDVLKAAKGATKDYNKRHVGSKSTSKSTWRVLFSL